MNIVKRRLYRIDVDIDANRLYISCHGIWNTVEDILDLGEDIQRALEYLSSGFTCCTDMSELEEASPDCNAQLSYNKMVLIEMGLSKDAFVISTEEHFAIDFHASTTKMEGRSFSTRSEAENWLAIY